MNKKERQKLQTKISGVKFVLGSLIDGSEPRMPRYYIKLQEDPVFVVEVRVTTIEDLIGELEKIMEALV